MIENHYILSSLPLLASVLGRKYGVQVRMGGNKAFTNGQIITLPSLPSSGDDALLGLVRGFIDHESAHIRYTDFSVLKGEITPLEKHIWNSLEDWRVENKLAEIFPGCRQNFIWLIKHLFLTKKEKIPTHSAHQVLNWILLQVRCWDVPELSAPLQKYTLLIETEFAGLTIRIGQVLKKAHNKCPDSRACMVYAKQIVSILKGMTCDIPNGSSYDESDPTEKELNCSESQKEQLRKLLNIPNHELPADMRQSLRRSLEMESHKTEEGLSVATVAKRKHSKLNHEKIVEVRATTNLLRTRLYSLLQATVLSRRHPARHGRLDHKNLNRAFTGSPKLFLKNAPSPKMSTAVHILIDCSGSMRRRITIASQSCYALASALKVAGINVAVTAFPAVYRDGQPYQTVTPVVKHGEGIHNRFKLSASGQTPLGEALWWAMQQMVPLRETRRLILTITDGVPDSIPTAKQAFETGRNAGFEFYGLGIMSPAIDSMPFDHCKNINHVNELALSMFEMLQQALIK
ncbi:MAG TPA: hypothetical protein DCS48_06155 [Desulfovibrio sp.]|nr:hypothetical protein [Desulfovibrio sp.]